MSEATPTDREGLRDRRGSRIIIWLGAATVLVALSALFPAATLESELTDAVAASDSVRLSDLETVRGSSFLVVCPYETSESVSERLGIEGVDAPDYRQVDDRQSVLIIEGEEIVDSVELPRNDIDFCATGDWLPLPTDIELTVTRDGGVVRVSP